MKYKIASTDQFIGLCQEAILSDRNRKVGIAKLAEVIDPEGVHLCTFTMLHNDVEWRTRWMVKVNGTDVPAEVFLDVSFKNYKKLAEHDTEASV
jgi:hypothetical protein